MLSRHQFIKLLLVLLLMHSISYCFGETPGKQIEYNHADIKILKNRTVSENTLWQGWKERYSLHLSKGTIIVDPYSDKVFSEAMGHALLFAIQFNDQDYFNKILNGLNEYFVNEQGLYSWEIMKDGNKHVDKSKSISASETEINVLMALLQANKLNQIGLWKNNKNFEYKKYADQLESNIWQNETINHNGSLLLLPSDGKNNPEWPIVSKRNSEELIKVAWAPTYFNPAYIKAFSTYYPNHMWNKLLDNGYELLNGIIENSNKLLANDHKVNGLNPIPAWVWIEHNEVTSSNDIVNYFKGETYEGATYSNEYDSIRIPMYVGIDYSWNKEPKAKGFIEKFLKESNVQSVEAAYVGAMPDYPKGWNNILSISQYGIANMVMDNEKEFIEYLDKKINIKNQCFGYSYESKYYYNQTFALYGYLILKNRFVQVL